MILAYEAIDPEGQQRSDTIEAASPSEALEVLRRRGLFVTEIFERKGAERPGASAAHARPTGRLPVKVLALFTRQMAMLLRAGSGVVPAVKAIRKQMRKPGQAALLGRIVHELEEGSTLTEALRHYPHTFDSTYCAIVQAGEASASLTAMFDRLSAMVGKRKAMRNKLLGAMAYPALLIAMSVNIIGVMLFFVLPRFARMFEDLGATVPASTQMLIDGSRALQEQWYLVLAAAIAAIVGAVALLRSDMGRQWLANVQTRVPVIGRLFARLIQAQVFRTMGLLLESRVGVLDSLELTRGITRNDQFQKLFSDIENEVTSGGVLSEAFERGNLVEPYICQAVKTGEDSGNLGGAMTYCADMLDESNTEVINTVAKLIEPAILIGMGLMVGSVAVSLFMPLFDLTAAV